MLFFFLFHKINIHRKLDFCSFAKRKWSKFFFCSLILLVVAGFLFFLQLAKFHSNSECICIYKLFDSIGLIKISKPKKLELVDINRYIRTNVLELLVSIRQPMKSPSKDPNIRIRVNTFYHPWLICFCVMQCVAFQLLVANTLSFEKMRPILVKGMNGKEMNGKSFAPV